MINCVTTMNKEYYDCIGKLMILTWCKYFPSDAKLHLYLEDFSLDFNDPRFVIGSWNDEIIPRYNQWLGHWKSCKENKYRSSIFTKKALSQIAAWTKIKAGKFLWLDADIVFLDYFTEEQFNDTINHSALASWGNGNFESGTVFINLNHKDWDSIRTIYEGIYNGSIPFPKGANTNTDRFFPGNTRLVFPTGWLDGAILGYACTIASSDYKNLNSLCNNKNSNTPLNDSKLGKYMIHLKAKRKHSVNEILKKKNRQDLLQLQR
jgi:hypothetical protein